MFVAALLLQMFWLGKMLAVLFWLHFGIGIKLVKVSTLMWHS